MLYSASYSPLVARPAPGRSTSSRRGGGVRSLQALLVGGMVEASRVEDMRGFRTQYQIEGIKFVKYIGEEQDMDR